MLRFILGFVVIEVGDITRLGREFGIENDSGLVSGYPVDSVVANSCEQSS